MLVNQKAGGYTYRKLLPHENDFKTCSAEIVMPTRPKVLGLNLRG